ncbi:MAG TPA: endonuclease/exonuclease/phosphatase family protein [Prolixibacteraceae bacterium]|nr:endonuclease/exonuclease/phosphatase family protein [Prolixibacteraceae bacterium]
MKRIFKYIFLLGNVVLVVALLATYLVPEVNPSKFWIPSVLGLAYPYILIGNCFFIVFWLVFHWRYLFLSLICILIGLHVNLSYFQLFPSLSKKEGVKVLSFNVYHFYSFLDNKKEKTSIIDFIAAQNANIICLQESKLQKEGVLNPVKLKSKFPGIQHCQLAHQSNWGGPVTFTSYPIASMGEIRFEDSKNMVIYTDVLIDSDTVRVYNCHLQSYGINSKEYAAFDSYVLNTNKIKGLRSIASKLKKGNIYRSGQVLKLVSHISDCRYPVIVCGDFNDTPISFTYGKISSLLNDSFIESGWGISNTYRGQLPQYRIDYIFHSKAFKAYNYKRHNVSFSDHYPISTVLVRKK